MTAEIVKEEEKKMKAIDLLTKLNAIYEGTEPSVELIRHKAKMTKKYEKPKLHLISKAA